MKWFTPVLAVAMLAVSPLAAAAINILACEPEWASLAQELGGERVKALSATTAKQDPHRIEARPSLLARARNADLLVCTGAELEAGWLPILQQQSGNGRIQTGRTGYFEAANYVTMLEIPVQVDRSMGDVHARGNPHIHLDPRNIARVAKALSRRLQQIDPANARHYQARHADFSARWERALQKWSAQAAGLQGKAVAVQHKDLSYFVAWTGLREVAVLEPKPGIEPSTAHLSGVLAQLRRTPATAVIRSAYQSPRASQWLANKAGIPAVELPYTVGGAPGAENLFGLFDVSIARLAAAAG
jgi:zinc/manganese transport system substrate-binding protein